MLFSTTLFLPEDVRGAHVFPPVTAHACGCIHVCALRCSPMFTVIIGKLPWWTRARSSTPFCRRGFHPERSKNTNRDFRGQQLCHFPATPTAKYFCLHKSSGQTGHRWYFQQRHCLIWISVLFFNLYWTRRLTWEWRVLFRKQESTWNR